jgi:hypothetical protein
MSPNLHFFLQSPKTTQKHCACLLSVSDDLRSKESRVMLAIIAHASFKRNVMREVRTGRPPKLVLTVQALECPFGWRRWTHDEIVTGSLAF